MIPGAWYDLSGRVSSAQAIASCALEALPSDLKGLEYDRMNHASHLIAAVQDILELAAQDVVRMEQQLNEAAFVAQQQAMK